MSRTRPTRIAVLAVVTATTLGIHYGWFVEPLFGHVHWLHAVHGRFCYIPIVMAAAWFGLRGGLVAATAITIAVIPLVARSISQTHEAAVELAEIVLYYALGGLIGILVDRENAARRAELAAREQVERSQKLSLVGQLAASVAHEIKNPLASIKGAADILTDPETDEDERAEFREILRGEVRRIDATVTEFLEFARPRQTRFERVDLADIVRGACRQIEPEAARVGVSLAVDAPARLAIDGDAGKLRQLVLNLMLNAVQAVDGSGRVRVRVETVEDDRVRVRVTDTGHGIEPAALERIFEPFYTTRASGTGLGLAVARGIVEAHDGAIAIESEPGTGTTVTVELPTRRTPEAARRRGAAGEDA